MRLRLAGFIIACLLAPRMLAAQRLSLAVPLDTLVAAAARDSLDPGRQYDLGVGYWFYRRYGAADSAFRRAIAIEPKYARGYLALAWLQYARRPKLGKWEAKHQLPDSLKPVVAEAERFYEQAFLIDPLVDLQILGLVFGPDRFTMLPGSADNYIVALVDGPESFWAGQYDGAYALLDRPVAKVPPAERAGKIPEILLWYHGLAELVQPLLARVRTRLNIRAEADTALRSRLGRILAARAAAVRWGSEAAEEFIAHNDPDVPLAISCFPRLPELLRSAGR